MTGTRTEAANTPPSTEELINGLAELMAHSTRTPVLRRPDEYDMEYEDVFFPAMDGVTLEGWFIPADSDRLIICNHPMPCNRYGYPGHLDPWTDFGGFEVNFLPETQVLHDAGYNVLTYDLRNHGRSGTGSGGIIGHGVLEYRDVIGSLHYTRTRHDTNNMKTALYSRCLGANSTVVAMTKYPEEFRHIRAMIALQPAAPRGFVEAALDRAGIADGRESFDNALHRRSGYRLDDFRPIEEHQGGHRPDTRRPGPRRLHHASVLRPGDLRQHLR
jgi:pimeloyl-ACP methyl ester carboxylesterase